MIRLSIAIYIGVIGMAMAQDVPDDYTTPQGRALASDRELMREQMGLMREEIEATQALQMIDEQAIARMQQRGW